MTHFRKVSNKQSNKSTNTTTSYYYHYHHRPQRPHESVSA